MHKTKSSEQDKEELQVDPALQWKAYKFRLNDGMHVPIAALHLIVTTTWR